MPGILLIFSAVCFSQSIATTIDKNHILVGDHINLNIDVQTNGRKLIGISIDELTGAEGIEVVKIDKRTQVIGQESRFNQKVIITSFDSGAFYIPPIYALTENTSGAYDTSYSLAIPITVNTVPPDSAGLAPLKEILVEEKNWRDYLSFIIPCIVLIAGLLFYLWWRRRRKKYEEVVIAGPPPPPHEVALDALYELESEKLWQKGEIKQYESRLSKVLRKYIEDIYQFPALEWTTREIERQLKKMDLRPDLYELVMQTLPLSDMVKFAKVKPEIEVHQEQMGRVKKFVHETHLIQKISEEEE